MSLETWKAEFYPVEVHKVPREQAAAHSLKKWEGLRKEGLERHGCKLDLRGNVGAADGWLIFDADSCALCQHFATGKERSVCEGCALEAVRGGVACDQQRDDELVSPYEARKTEGPEPMIGWLKKAVELEASAAA